jgi:hypothetical protein
MTTDPLASSLTSLPLFIKIQYLDYIRDHKISDSMHGAISVVVIKRENLVAIKIDAIEFKHYCEIVACVSISVEPAG